MLRVTKIQASLAKAMNDFKREIPTSTLGSVYLRRTLDRSIEEVM